MAVQVQTRSQAATQWKSKEEITAGYRPKRQIPTWTIIRHLVLLTFCLIVLFPLVWVLLLSVKTIPDANLAKIWPNTFEFGHYAYAWEKIPTLRQNYLNSIIVTTATVAITT